MGLGNALAALAPITFIISDKAQLGFLPKNSKHIMIHSPTSPREPFTALVLNKYKPDIVFSPLQSIGSIGRKFKLILNQQDMTYYKLPKPPEQLPLHIRAVWRIYHSGYLPGRMVLNSADMIATVSQTSRQEILAAKLTKRPIIVVPNAAEDLSKLTHPAIQDTKPPKNLVYMGAFLPHKNVETLIKMMAYLPNRKLHLLSRISVKRKIQLSKIIPEGASVVFHEGVSDKKYADLLSDNAIMVSASKAEGFGLPLIEVLNLGVPAVVTAMPIFCEVAGEGALYADPDNPKDFADKIKQLDDLKTRKQHIKAGKKHIKKYSWEKSAKILHASMLKLLS
jgi:glycosyltransferase involved in cell wall biosynthesis